MGAVEGTVPNMGNGSPLGPGEILFGGGVAEEMGKDTEWEVRDFARRLSDPTS